MVRTSAFHDDARAAIDPLHRAVDAHPRMVEMLTRPIDQARYVDLLVFFRRVWPCLEAALPVARCTALLGESAPPLRGALVDDDLRTLDVAMHDAVAPIRDLRRSTDTDEALLGYLYTLEGARLGGAAIAAWVRRDLALVDGLGTTFLSGGSAEGSGTRLEKILEVAKKNCSDDNAFLRFTEGALAPFEVILDALDAGLSE